MRVTLMHARILAPARSLLAGRLLVPVEDAADEGRDERHLRLGAGDRLVQAEEQREVAVDALLLEDLGGADAFPGRRELDQDALALRCPRPRTSRLGDEIGIASGKVSQLKTVSIRPASLDAPISDDDSTEFGEIVGDEEAQTPFELLRDKNLRNEVGGLLDVLDDREKEDHLPAFRSGRREAQNARGSR